MPFNSAAEDFWDNVSWNSALAPSRAKPKRKGIGWHMKPDELIKKLAELGIAIDRRTLSRYVKWKLVTAPESRSGGKGVYADYPEHAVAEAAAAAELMQRKRWKKEAVAGARMFFAVLQANGINMDSVSEDEIQAAWEKIKPWERIRPETGDDPDKWRKIRPLLAALDTKTWWILVKYYLALLN